MTRPATDSAIPDRDRIARCRQTPESGPSILFFSGGTALRETSRELIGYTHNSVHLITPFDSGGSSAIIRQAFAMPAVGDIRNRLMALADQSVAGNREIYALFTHRLSKQMEQDELRSELARMQAGEHALVNWIKDPMRRIIRDLFGIFIKHMSDDFDLRGASIGNLMLTAGYLSGGRRLAQVIDTFSELAQVRGVVRPTVDEDMHLAVRLADGQTVIGQHLMTGKETGPLGSPIESIWLTDSLGNASPVRPPITDDVAELVTGADLVCHPIGSLYSSVIANLLPAGVGRAIAKNSAPKVFVPNLGHDPEAPGLSVADRVRIIRETLAADGVKPDSVLNFVLVDTHGGDYEGGLDAEALERMNVRIVDCQLITDKSAPLIDGRLLGEALISLF